jgi:flagellar hook protein FlgE
MLDSIYIGMSGLLGYSRGLKVISNNVANMNTPGFKASQLQFGDLFYSGGNAAQGNANPGGGGLKTGTTTLNFRQGEFRQTGNNMDLAIDGDGLFVLRNDAGEIRYSRAGQFEFNGEGILVNRADGAKVLGLDANGKLAEIHISGSRSNPPKATASLKFTGNLSGDDVDHTIDGVKVFDSVGGEHTLKLAFTNGAPATPGTWTVTVTDGTTTVHTGTIKFVNGLPDPAASTLSFTYSPSGVPAIPLSINFAENATSFAAGTTSTLVFSTQDGYAAGVLTQAGVDEQGRLKLTYSNGQSTHDQRLALAHFDTESSLEALGGNLFKSANDAAVHYGTAGTEAFGDVSAGMVELSNVDLSREFGDLIVTQRGYQASSQIVSTANEMIQQLFDMKSRR